MSPSDGRCRVRRRYGLIEHTLSRLGCIGMFLSVAVQHSNKFRTRNNLCLKKTWLCRITTLAGNDYRSGASMAHTFLAESDRKHMALRREIGPLTREVAFSAPF
ncbi:protein of unknown function [Burkholderia multivorans]